MMSKKEKRQNGEAIATTDILVEIGCEELPASEQTQLVNDLAAEVEKFLKDSQLAREGISKFSTPRRLAIIIQRVQVQQEERNEIRRGPAVSASYDAKGKPTPAAQGFAKSCGLEVSQLTKLKTAKGEYLSAEMNTPGKSVQELLPEALGQIIPKLSRQRSMRWDDSNLRFARAIRWLLAIADDKVLDWQLGHLKASNLSYGHRFYAPKPLKINNPGDYASKLLEDGKVVVSAEERRGQIVQQVEKIAKAAKLEVVNDEDLLNELAAITEYPHAYLGEFDAEFLKLPAEVLETVLAQKQKYLTLKAKGKIAAKFIFVANINSADKDLLVYGNEAVLRPRLADASFFYQQDLQVTLDTRLQQLGKLAFFAELGTMKDKSERCMQICRHLCEQLKTPAEVAVEAARLCKFDLPSLMVQEFPELQGVIGSYYLKELGGKADAEKDKANLTDVSQAIKEHYLPHRSGDAIPTSLPGQILAITDRLDTLLGMFGKGHTPSGEKDPYSLRRAALGIGRIAVEGKLQFDLHVLLEKALEAYAQQGIELGQVAEETADTEATPESEQESEQESPAQRSIQEVQEFINDRIMYYAKKRQLGADAVDAVFYCTQKDIYDGWLRAYAIEKNHDKSTKGLVEINKRLKNILGSQSIVEAEPNPKLLQAEEEKKVWNLLRSLEKDVAKAVKEKNYAACFKLLNQLQQPLEDFFNNVMVMVEEEEIKNNRLVLLSNIHKLFLQIGDLSRVSAA